MNPSELIKRLLRETCTTQVELAERLQYDSQGTLSNRLNRGNMKVDTFVKMLNALGYELAVRPIGDPEKAYVVEIDD